MEMVFKKYRRMLFLAAGLTLLFWASGGWNPAAGSWLDKVKGAVKKTVEKKQPKTKTGVMAVRGLDESEDAGAGARDYEALKVLEAIYITDLELDAFLLEGGIKP